MQHNEGLRWLRRHRVMHFVACRRGGHQWCHHGRTGRGSERVIQGTGRLCHSRVFAQPSDVRSPNAHYVTSQLV
eukprot:14129281-Alexandrium_andersonii.AAC.1